MGHILAIILLSLCVALPANAGAWLRDKGTGFLSLTGTLFGSADTFNYKSAVYGEWGLSPKITVGFDLNDRPGLTGHALVFARVPLLDLGKKGRLSLEFGGGGHHYVNQWHPMYKTGLSYGRDLSTQWGPGWVAVDMAVEHRLGSGDPFYKLDATIGLSANRRFNPMLQIESSYFSNSQIYWAITPSVVIKGQNQTRWIFGIEHRSAYPKGYGLKVALWREF